jgi:hypothetical protein
MTPEGMTIDLLESKLSGSVSSQEALCNYMDDWIAEVILGQEPKSSGGGALAAASAERVCPARPGAGRFGSAERHAQHHADSVAVRVQWLAGADAASADQGGRGSEGGERYRSERVPDGFRPRWSVQERYGAG